MPASRVQQAIYEYMTDPSASILSTVTSHDLNPSTFHRIVLRWKCTNSVSNLKCPSDIVDPSSKPGRPLLFTAEEEELMARTIIKFWDDGWPLTINLVQQVAEHSLQRYCPDDRRALLKHGTPSSGWVSNFIARRDDLRYVSMRTIEDKRKKAISPATVAEHIGRVKGVLNRYRIGDASRVFNIEECGISFDKMNTRSLLRGVAHASASKQFQAAGIRTKGNLNHVTVIAVVAADGKEYKPVVVFPGKQPHFRRLADGKIETVRSILPTSYVYHRDPAGVDTVIFTDWVSHFLEETRERRKEDKYLAIIMDAYSAHIQLEALSTLRDHNVHVIALPSHSSNALQPLDVTVFPPFKSAIQSELHRASRHTCVVDVFTASSCIANAYNAAVTSRNIIHGFEATGMWVRSDGGPSVDPLTKLFRRNGQKITVAELMHSFDKSTHALIFNADVVDSSTVRKNTQTGVHLTSDAVIQALAVREQRRQRANAPRVPSPFMRRAIQRRDRIREDDVDDRLAPERQPRRAHLNCTRITRRDIRKQRVQEKRLRNSVSSPSVCKVVQVQ